MSGLLLGLMLGARHALEPDHLAAVSTLVARHRSPWSGAWVGAFWGLGHSLALFGVAVALALLNLALPPALAQAFELAVAVMLVGLGAKAIHQALTLGGTGPEAFHRHGVALHRHAGTRDHLHLGRWTLARQPLLVGIAHGMAGSGALTALALASTPNSGSRWVYLALFGLGSVLGMIALTGLAGWPLSKLQASPRLARTLSGATGLLSVGVGAWWGARVYLGG